MSIDTEDKIFLYNTDLSDIKDAAIFRNRENVAEVPSTIIYSVLFTLLQNLFRN